MRLLQAPTLLSPKLVSERPKLRQTLQDALHGAIRQAPARLSTDEKVMNHWRDGQWPRGVNHDGKPKQSLHGKLVGLGNTPSVDPTVRRVVHIEGAGIFVVIERNVAKEVLNIAGRMHTYFQSQPGWALDADEFPLLPTPDDAQQVMDGRGQDGAVLVPVFVSLGAAAPRALVGKQLDAQPDVANQVGATRCDAGKERNFVLADGDAVKEDPLEIRLPGSTDGGVFGKRTVVFTLSPVTFET